MSAPKKPREPRVTLADRAADINFRLYDIKRAARQYADGERLNPGSHSGRELVAAAFALVNAMQRFNDAGGRE